MSNTSTDNKTALKSGLILIKALLSETTAYEHETSSIRLVETHISWVLLTGQYAYKIKKPVNFGFLDFSTLEKRRFLCTEELRLNRRLAEDLYIDVVPITGQPNHPQMNGTGEAIEYAVRMIQFPSQQILSDRAGNRQLSTDEIDQLTEIVADFHDAIDKTDAQSQYGDSENIRHWFDENFHHIEPLLADTTDKQQLQTIQAWGDNEWINKSGLMEDRKQQGFVRECHGDLHLGNMTIIDGKVRLFDCIEFNPLLRWIDIISEAAFLVIDLLHFGYDNYAWRFLNRYLQHTGDYQGLALLRYYLVYRALVRAKISLLKMVQQQHDDAACKHARSDYSAFANLAEHFTRQNRTTLIITHGFSGSGKSTFAGQLAEKTGALQIRSDIERKRLFGYQPQENSGSAVNSGLYTQAAGEKTYQQLAALAEGVLKVGFSAIIDAAFLKAEQRDRFRQLASECDADFFIVDFQASDEELCRRIKDRQHDASEATIEVLHRQQQSAQPLSASENAYSISIDTESDNALEMLLDHFAGTVLTANH